MSGEVDDTVVDTVENETDDVIEESGEEAIDFSEEGGEQVSESQVQDVKDSLVEEAKKQGATKEEIRQLKKVFDLKVNGKTIKKEIDLSDEDAVRRELQLAYAGRQSMQEKTELENMLRQQLGDWKSNPWQFFSDMGLDPDQLVESRVKDQLAELEKSPEQKERERIQKEIEKFRKEAQSKDEELKRIKEAQEEEKKQLAFEKASVELDNEITKALDAHSSLPATPRVLKQIADTMLWAYDNAEKIGINPDELSVDDVIPTVEREIRKEFDLLLSSLGDDALEAFLGNKTLDRLRKKRMSAAKKIPSASSIKASETAKTATKDVVDNKPKMSIDDFMRLR
jgi:hypothetical protein